MTRLSRDIQNLILSFISIKGHMLLNKFYDNNKWLLKFPLKDVLLYAERNNNHSFIYKNWDHIKYECLNFKRLRRPGLLMSILNGDIKLAECFMLRANLDDIEISWKLAKLLNNIEIMKQLEMQHMITQSKIRKY